MSYFHSSQIIGLEYDSRPRDKVLCSGAINHSPHVDLGSNEALQGYHAHLLDNRKN